ncbi:MAG: tRNA 4-thiouridine(8) synthase ThiI [Patescibacteria group bacterium]|nr:tRNA 4-thiouridine(8) synthase ThiI [Patescibacteria group bacterium]
MQKAKALVLFSGGLDSMLAVKLLQIQGIKAESICFTSNFFNCTKAKDAAEELGIKLKVVDISREMLEIVKNPLSGYGKHLNPCVDCHALMARRAGEFLQSGSTAPVAAGDYGANNIFATGEVLGQRPFSQTKDALARVEKFAGVEILRPLSAKKLPETEYEKQGLVDRGRMLNIIGRSRERQMELAEKYKLKNYSTPAGGCLLTDSEFSNRLLKMLDYWQDCGVNDVELLKYGRVFWLTLSTPKHAKGRQDANKSEKVLIVVGRHKEDNENLEKLARKGDVIMELKEIAGPLSLIRIKNYELRIKNNILKINVPEKLKMGELELGEEKSGENILRIAGLLTGYYAVKARKKKVNCQLRVKN